MSRRLVAAAAAVLVVVTAGCGGAGRPHGAVTIRTLAYLPPGGGPITGIFRASGAFTDSGTVFDTFKVLSSSSDSSRAAVERTLYSARGTIRFRFVLTQVRGRGHGRWHVQSGTGRYKGLAGEGAYAGRIDFLPQEAEKIRDTMRGTVR